MPDPDPQPESGWTRLWAAVQPALDRHPVDAGALGEYAIVLQERGRDAAERAFPEVAAHVRTGCARCAADLGEFPFADAQARAESSIRRIIATLLAPSPVVQVRGSAGPSVHSYAAEDVALSISIFAGQPARQDSFFVEGIVTHGDVTDATARLTQRGIESHTSTIDKAGNFGFDDVAAGEYQLELTLTNEVVLVVESVRVGSES